MSNDESRSARVREVIEAHGVTQIRLAEALGLTQTAASRRMRGLTPWRLTELEIVAGLMDISLMELIGEDQADGIPA